jgi:hypothetical protein
MCHYSGIGQSLSKKFEATILKVARSFEGESLAKATLGCTHVAIEQ